MKCSTQEATSPIPPWHTRAAFRNAPVQRVAPYSVSNPCWEQTHTVGDPVYRLPDTMPRVTSFTRFTPNEWSKNMMDQWTTAESARNISEKVRGEALNLVRQTDEETKSGFRESGRRLGERINDVSFWTQEVRSELDRLTQEISRLQDMRRLMERALAETEKPLHVAQECLLLREKRRGIDLVRDGAEEALLKEVDLIADCQEKMRRFLERVNLHLGAMRLTQHELDRELNRKHAALTLDARCHQMNKFSPGINFFSGVERMDQCYTTPDVYPCSANDALTRAQNERNISTRLRTDGETLLSACAHDIWTSWNNTNASLQHRTSEQTEARDKLNVQLAKINAEIIEQKKYIEMVRKAICDKSGPLQVAHTRLELRTHRPDVELCCDAAHHRLVKEVQDLQHNADKLQCKLQEAEEALQSLANTRAQLEEDLRIKANSIYVDREQCLGIRKSFPYNVSVVFS